MFCKYFHFVFLVVVFLHLKGAASFFVKQFRSRYDRAPCINDTGQIQSSGSWGNLSFLESSYGSCLDPSAQFRFRDNGAMLNLQRQGCLAAFNKDGSGYNLDMFYLYVDSVSLDTAACAQKPNEGIYRAITQTSDGRLSVHYKGKKSSSFQTWCARSKHQSQLYQNYSVWYHIALRSPCSYGYRFIFGSVACYGEKMKNANCPKDQYMVVKFASFRGLLGTKTCGLSDDYSCEVDVTCLVKKQCDGLHECSITVDDNLFSGDSCPGLSNYLYFEYQCADTVKHYKEPCVRDISLSYSALPYEGVVQITTDSGTKNVCWGSLKKWYPRRTVCRHLGYEEVNSLINVSVPTDAKHAIFSGSIICNGEEKYLSQCSISSSSSESCPGLSYIHCISDDHYFYRRYFSRRISPRPLLENKRKFPDSTFSASASSEGHSASDARITSGSSWCAPVSDEKHYLQVDLRTLHEIHSVITYGDSTSTKWVVTYNLNYTVDFLNWETSAQVSQGNKNAYDYVARQPLQIKTKGLRFIPLAFVGQPCMRVDIWAESMVPDKPRNLTVANITSSSAVISWLDPESQRSYYRRYSYSSRFFIKLKKDNTLILNISTGKVNEYEFNNLTPYTAYEISVAAGNKYYGFGEDSFIAFITSEEAPSGPPLNIRTTSRSSSSLLVTWDPPEKTKRNGIIISYTACISHSENDVWFRRFFSGEKKWLIAHLNASTKYYIRVFASTKVGHGNYSESEGFSTNGKAAGKAINKTLSTLTFQLHNPSKPFVYFYVVALKLEDGSDHLSPDNYKIDDLVTYTEAMNLTNQRPYIAAVITACGADENAFVLGDGRNTNYPTRDKHRLTTIGYFNGPLEPGTSYSIFRRIIINDKGDYYSTDWSPASKTIGNTVLGGGPNGSVDGSTKYLAGIIVLVILLVISCAVIAYFIYETRFKSPNTEEAKPETSQTTNDQKDSRHGYDTPVNNYENVEDDHSTYTALKRPASREASDDHIYASLNQEPNNVEGNQGETGF